MEKRVMKSYGNSLVILLAMATLSGCTTVKAVKGAGSELKDGHVVAGLWDGTMGVAMALLTDVVTLGGSTSPEEGTKAILAATGNTGVPPHNSGTTAQAAPSTQSGSARHKIFLENYNSCIEVQNARQDTTGKAMFVGYDVVNSCNQRLQVHWCAAPKGQSCMTLNSLEDIPAGGKERTWLTSSNGVEARIVACEETHNGQPVQLDTAINMCWIWSN